MGYEQGFVLLNYQTSMVISAPNDDSAVKLTKLVDMNRGVWRFLGVDYGAIQLQANTNMNLNVEGDGPYNSGTRVLVWDWSGGDSNEIWNFSMVGF